MFDGSDAFMKEWRTKLASSNDFLGHGHSGEMDATSVGMTIIKNLFYLFMGEVVVKDGVHSPLI